MSIRITLATASRSQSEPGLLRPGRCAWAALVLLTASAAGCGQNGPPRVGVHGIVKMDGRPLPWGTIYFRPEMGVPGPMAAARIEDGGYHLEPDDGPAVGRHRVEVRTVVDTETEKDVQRTEPLPEVVPVPARYHRASELVVETTLDGPNEFDFDLTSKQ